MVLLRVRVPVYFKPFYIDSSSNANQENVSLIDFTADQIK